MLDHEDSQCNLDSDNIPEDPPDPPPPPDEPMERSSDLRSFELEGEQEGGTSLSIEAVLTRAEVDTSGATIRDKDAGTVPKKLRNMPERVSEWPDQQVRENSPRRVPDSTDEPGSETAVPGSAQSIQGYPRAHPSDSNDETNMSTRDRWPRRPYGLSTAADTIAYTPATTGASTMSKRMRYAHIPSQEATEARRRHPEMSKMIWAAEKLLKAPNTIGLAPGPMRTRASSK
ncbi:hypothetical protein OG21DRAFT_1491613 [Imleria badia]|nr:hypothetical protein OG21DRAFT_1491613 [Imleria badia]